MWRASRPRFRDNIPDWSRAITSSSQGAKSSSLNGNVGFPLDVRFNQDIFVKLKAQCSAVQCSAVHCNALQILERSAAGKFSGPSDCLDRTVLYSVQCTVYSVQQTVYSVQCTANSALPYCVV